MTTSFNHIISEEDPIYKPEKGRYWLYVGLGCPFCHRVMIARSLKGLNPIVGISVAQFLLGPEGWNFIQAEGENLGDRAYTYDGGIPSSEDDRATAIGDISDNSSRLFVDGTFDPHYNTKSVKELYYRSNPNYAGSFSLPILWDLKTHTVVNNDSGEIIRIFNSGVFDDLIDEESRAAAQTINLAPKHLIPILDKFNNWLGPNVNIGVYKVGKAETQSEHEKFSEKLYESLDKVEKDLQTVYQKLEKEYGTENKERILSKYFLFENQITDSDIRLFTTIARFDNAYAQHFKCNYKLIRTDYPYIHLWFRNLYWNHKSFRSTSNFNHIKLFYTRSHKNINPLGITPRGPKYDVLKL